MSYEIPGYTCPSIDAMKKDLLSGLRELRAAIGHCEDEAATEAMERVESEFYGLEDQLEELRTQNDRLRTAAEGYKSDLEKANNEISSLERALSENAA